MMVMVAKIYSSFTTIPTTITITPHEPTTVVDHTVIAAAASAAAAVAHRLEQEFRYLDEYYYLTRQRQQQVQHHLNKTITIMDNFHDNQRLKRDHSNSNKAAIAMSSMLDDLKPDNVDDDCEIYLSDNDDNDYYNEQKSNKEDDDSKLSAAVHVVALRRSHAIFLGSQQQNGSSSSNTIIGQLDLQEQQQQQQQQSASFKNDTVSSNSPIERRIVTLSSSSLIPSPPSCSSLQRALRLENGDDTAHATTADGGEDDSRHEVVERRLSSLQRALQLERQRHGSSCSNFAPAAGIGSSCNDAASEALAQQLQQQYEHEEMLERQQHCLEAENLMHTSVTGRAWKFVEQVLALHQEYKQSGLLESAFIVPLATDDLVFLAEKMIQQQDLFRTQNKPTSASLGFHFTTPINLSQIRSNGLLTKQERHERNINSTFNGSAYGDGVYTASDVTLGSTGRYGDIGIICACLNGEEKKGGRNFDPDDNDQQQQDSNVLMLKSGTRMVVLKTSSQCLGIFEFPRFLIANKVMNIGILKYWVGLHNLVEQFFNHRTEV